MRKSKLALSLAAALGASYAAAVPINLPPAPLFLQFVDAEQVSVTNSIAGGLNARGIIQVTQLTTGTVLAPTGSDIQGGGSNVFVNGFGPQVLGVFQIASSVTGANCPTGSSCGRGGFVDLYWWDSNSQNVGTEIASGANTAKFNATSSAYTGFSCTAVAGASSPGCYFLGRFNFADGSAPGFPLVNTVTPVDISSADGTSKSYLDANTSMPGFWTTSLNSNFFSLDPLNNPCNGTFNYPAGTPVPGAPGGISCHGPHDIRLDNNFTHNGGGAWNVAGTDIIGLRSNDPARAFAVPEPASIALIGIALAGLGAMRRRRDA